MGIPSFYKRGAMGAHEKILGASATAFCLWRGASFFVMNGNFDF